MTPAPRGLLVTFAVVAALALALTAALASSGGGIQPLRERTVYLDDPGPISR
jgi:hypothetical protein